MSDQQAPIKFEVGSTYTMRSVCDRECKWSFMVTKRTGSTITLSDGKRCKVKVYDGAEQCAPLGAYSMSPVLSAKRKVV
jgi:hypothetical protein